MSSEEFPIIDLDPFGGSQQDEERKDEYQVGKV